MVLFLLAACMPTPEEAPDPWVEGAQPCGWPEALWADDGGHLFVGCTRWQGGLHERSSGGSWAAPWVQPIDFFDGFDVKTISRSDDGLLYIGGEGGADRVVSLAHDGTVTPVFTSQGEPWDSFTVDDFRRADGGFAVADAWFATGLVWRASDAEPFGDGSAWWSPGRFQQILAMDAEGAAVYAVGSTVEQPPMVYLPPRSGSDAFALDPVALGVARTGMLTAIDADPDGLIVGGVDAYADVGLVFVSDVLDARAPADWTELALPDLYDAPTRVEGVCRRGADLAAVGERAGGGVGLVVSSRDGGATWVDASAHGAPPLSRCVVGEGGALTVVGRGGYLATSIP